MEMSGIVQPLALLSLLLSLASCMEVIDFVPDPSGIIEKRQISTKGPLRLRCVGPGADLVWQYQEALEVPKAAKTIVEDDARILHFDSFDESLDGLYTCQHYKAAEKKRVRLYFFDDVMPSGFHECAADQKNQCVHAKACRAADDTNQVSCVCMKEWQGERCDDPVLLPSPITTALTGMPIVWIVFSILVLVGIIVAVKCHNDDEKSVLVPTTDPGINA